MIEVTLQPGDTAISSITVREVWKGIEKKRFSDPITAKAIADSAQRVFDAYAGRILPFNTKVAAEWGRMLAQSEKHISDTGIAATAMVYKLAIVTRNTTDFRRRGVSELDPSKFRVQTP